MTRLSGLLWKTEAYSVSFLTEEQRNSKQVRKARFLTDYRHLRAEQGRIHERQLQELLLRRNIENQTFSVARLQQNTQTQPASETQVGVENNTSVGMIQQQVQQSATSITKKSTNRRRTWQECITIGSITCF